MVSVVNWQPTGGLMVQADWFDPKVGGHLAPCSIHRMNRVNSRNAFSMMTAPWYYYYNYNYYYLQTHSAHDKFTNAAVQDDETPFVPQILSFMWFSHSLKTAFHGTGLGPDSLHNGFLVSVSSVYLVVLTD